MGIRLEIGSGNCPHDGYVHLDINPEAKDVDLVADFTAGIPLEDNSCEEVLAVNCIEHVFWYQVRDILKEIYRILQPGGVLKAHLPDLQYVIDVVLPDSHQGHPTKDWRLVTGPQPTPEAHTEVWDYMNHIIFSTGAQWNAHHAIFTYPLAEKLFRECGFTRFEHQPLRNCFFIFAYKD